jgi:hypothetical protein
MTGLEIPPERKYIFQSTLTLRAFSSKNHRLLCWADNRPVLKHVIWKKSINSGNYSLDFIERLRYA